MGAIFNVLLIDGVKAGGMIPVSSSSFDLAVFLPLPFPALGTLPGAGATEETPSSVKTGRASSSAFALSCASVVEAEGSSRFLKVWKVMKRSMAVELSSKREESACRRVARNERKLKAKNGYCGRKRYVTFTDVLGR